MRCVVLLGISIALSGCGIAARVEARGEYQDSASQYKRCLQANVAAPARCDGLRLAMETDERKYNNLSAGIREHGQRSDTITILNR